MHGAPSQNVTDNGKEQINTVVRETLESLGIQHVKTSYYNPRGNGKCKRLHKTMNDILSTKIKEDVSTWDVYINQLAAVRFIVSASTQLSTFTCYITETQYSC